MAMPQTIENYRHPFTTGTDVKRMLVNGEWVRAASGKTFESRNPATGDLLAMVAEGDKEDIDRAVAAARRAFEGSWSKFKPFERQALLLKIAEIVEKNYEELSLLDTVDMGAPSARTRGTKQRVLGMLRWYAGMATSIHGETINNSLPGEIFSFTLKEPVGVVGAIIPWNGPLTASIWKIGPALATGCTVVLKPAEEAPLNVLTVAKQTGFDRKTLKKYGLDIEIGTAAKAQAKASPRDASRRSPADSLRDRDQEIASLRVRCEGLVARICIAEGNAQRLGIDPAELWKPLMMPDRSASRAGSPRHRSSR